MRAEHRKSTSHPSPSCILLASQTQGYIGSYSTESPGQICDYQSLYTRISDRSYAPYVMLFVLPRKVGKVVALKLEKSQHKQDQPHGDEIDNRFCVPLDLQEGNLCKAKVTKGQTIFLMMMLIKKAMTMKKALMRISNQPNL